MQHAQRQQQVNAQRQQQVNARRQQMEQRQNTQRQQQQVNERRQHMQQWQNSQRQQQMDARRQQMQQWQTAPRQQRVNPRREQQQQFHAQRQQRDAMRQPQREMRQQAAQPRELRQFERQQRTRIKPDANFGPVRRDQRFDGGQFADSGTRERFDRNAFSFDRQQRFDNRAARQLERNYYQGLRRQQQSFAGNYYSAPDWNYNQSAQPYSYYPYPNVETSYYDYRTYNVFYGDDYSDYDRFRVFNIYEPAYTAYDYYYPDALPIYRTYFYDEPYYGYSDGLDWKSLLFRSVIAAFFSNGDNVGYYDPYPHYAYYNDDNYYGYIPQYRYSQPYYTFGYTPTYAYYEPAAYYGYDQYSYYGVPSDYIGYPTFPYDDMVTLYSGGLGAELIQRAMSTGYYQGLLEGQMARRQGWDEEYYYDPYLYEQVMYDPYSSSMGDCRRYFSEGYEMGYADGRRGRDEFYLAEGGDIDLVSVLVGSTVILRS